MEIGEQTLATRPVKIRMPLKQTVNLCVLDIGTEIKSPISYITFIYVVGHRPLGLRLPCIRGVVNGENVSRHRHLWGEVTWSESSECSVLSS